MDKLRVVCPTCRTPIAQQEYNYEKQKWIWCNDSEQRLTKMADVQAIDEPEIKEGRNEGIEPSFYVWELNR